VEFNKSKMTGIMPYSLICRGNSFVGTFKHLKEAASAYNQQAGDPDTGICLARFEQKVVKLGRMQDGTGRADVE